MGRPAILKVDIVGDSRKLSAATRTADRDLSRIGGTAGRVGKVLGAGAVGGFAAVGAAMYSGLKDAAAYQQLQRQTAAVLKSTGGAAGVTAKHVSGLANQIESYSTLGDDAIQSGENLLLTFTNLRNAAGKGNDIFDQTTKIMADMSTALGQDTKTSAVQLGKALNDPIKGVSALQRVGVSFTAAQKDQIKALVESGNTMGAQKLILGELSKEFGGSAKAAGGTFAGALTHLKDAGQDFLRDAMLKLLPSLTKFAHFLQERAFPAVQRVASSLVDRLGPAFRSVAGFIRDRVIPAASGLFHWYAEKIAPALARAVAPILAGVAGLFRNIAGAVERNRGSLEKLRDGLKVIVEFLAQRVLPILGKVIQFGFKVLGKEIEFVIEAVATLTDGISWLIDKLEWIADHAGGIVSKVGGVFGRVAGVFGSGPPLVGAVGGLAGRSGFAPPAVGELAQASFAPGTSGGLAAVAGLVGRPVVVDSRSFPVTINVDGALDPVAVAHQLEAVLRDNAIRQRRQTAWGT